MFDVVDLPLPYNGIIGRPSLAKFMAASHYAYNVLKMPGPMGVIFIQSDEKYAIICVDQMYQEAVAAEAIEAVAPAKDSKRKGKADKGSGRESGKRTSSECAAPVDDVTESSNSKRPKAATPTMKKVPTELAGIDGTFTISATLDDARSLPSCGRISMCLPGN